jgi:hypothetical protein
MRGRLRADQLATTLEEFLPCGIAKRDNGGLFESAFDRDGIIAFARKQIRSFAVLATT